MTYTYYTCDVFTNQQFGGNPLAVFPHAQGLTTAQMQKIAREFNFSESTFVLPPEKGQTRRVRIFTPTTEVPFAGHPNIGTAFVLASIGELGNLVEHQAIVFEEEAGLVPIKIELDEDANIICELKAPQEIATGLSVPVEVVAHALSLNVADFVTATHAPQVASVGLPFVIAELRDRGALQRIKSNLAGFEQIEQLGIAPDVHVYVRSDDEFDIRARMFAPFDNVPEDPATGSANCALVGLLASVAPAGTGIFSWRIGQGIEMGRPSTLHARAAKRDGHVIGTWIGGRCVMVSKGEFFI